jgi:hypothetical protein
MPYITKVHGNRAIPMLYKTMKEKMDKTELLLLKKDGVYISGMILSYENEVPKLWSRGIKDGNTEHLKAGIVPVIHYFAKLYLRQKGHSRLHLGGSRAFLMDGTLRFKRERGMVVTGSPEKGFMIKPLSLSEGVRKFLAMNPFIYLDEKGLNGAVFVENGFITTEKDIEKIYRDLYIKGLVRLNIFLFGGEEKILEKTVPAALREGVASSAEREHPMTMKGLG